MVSFGLFQLAQFERGTDPARAVEEQLSYLEKARDGGWDSIWCGQHFLSDPVDMLQPIPLLSRFSAHSGGMHLGTSILLIALQNPVRLAEELATLDALSNGKLYVGVGLGYREEEFRAFRIDRSKAVTRFEQNLGALKELWTSNRPQLDELSCAVDGTRPSVRPIQKPHPPIWIAGNADAAVERAARIGHPWLISPHSPITTVERQLGRFRDVWSELRDSPAEATPLVREVVCGETRQEAWTAARRWLAPKYQKYRSWGQDKVMPRGDGFDTNFENLAADRFVIGSPDDCVEELLRWAALGVTDLILRVHWAGMPRERAEKSIHLLSTQVKPAVQAAFG